MRKKVVILAVVAACVLYLDQMTKALAVLHIKGRPPITVIDDAFDLVYVENTGAAFGLFAKSKDGVRIPVFHVVSTIAIAAIIYLFVTLKTHQTLLTVSLSAILGGAVGNFTDRVRLGYVVDFLDVHWGTLHWPAFNVADTAITIGVGLLILDMILAREGPAVPASPDPGGDGEGA